MTPTQRAAAERLAEGPRTSGELWGRAVIALLRELLVEPQGEPVAVVRSVQAGADGVKVKWLRGFAHPGDRLYAHPPQQRKPLTDEPVAWRYQDARGNYRYRKYVAGFDTEYKRLRPIPLYAHPPQQRKPLDATAVQELKLAVSGKPYLTVEQLVRQVERAHGITGEPT